MKHYYALFSGGLDSTLAILVTIAKGNPAKITPIFFNYGQKSYEAEAKAVKDLIVTLREYVKKCFDRETITIEDFREINIEGAFLSSISSILKQNPDDPDVPDVENRNMILISCAASVIMIDRKEAEDEAVKEGIKDKSILRPAYLLVGFLNEHYDTSNDFVANFNLLLESITKNDKKPKIQVIAPLIEPVESGQSSRVPIKKLVDIIHALNANTIVKKTWSCYYPQKNGDSCKKCGPCGKRESVISEAGMKLVKRKPRKKLSEILRYSEEEW